MRDVVFLVADKNMEFMVKGFFGRDGCHKSLGCGEFDFHPGDVKVASGDTIVFHDAERLLQTYQSTHAHAVVMIDNDWAGSKGPEAIQVNIAERLERRGWQRDQFVVVVLDPEIEAWFWQRNTHVEQVVWPRRGNPEQRRRGRPRPAVPLWEWLEDRGLWEREAPKPRDPKRALETARRQVGLPRSSAIYGELAAKVSTRGCQDEAFQALCAALRRWFPPEAA